MPSFYSEGNLIVRTESHEYEQPPKPSPKITQKPVVKENLWINKVQTKTNDTQNLTMNNFPTLN